MTKGFIESILKVLCNLCLMDFDIVRELIFNIQNAVVFKLEIYFKLFNESCILLKYFKIL